MEASSVAEIINSGPKTHSLSQRGRHCQDSSQPSSAANRGRIIIIIPIIIDINIGMSAANRNSSTWTTSSGSFSVSASAAVLETFSTSGRTLEKTSIHFVCNSQQQFMTTDGYDKLPEWEKKAIYLIFVGYLFNISRVYLSIGQFLLSPLQFPFLQRCITA